MKNLLDRIKKHRWDLLVFSSLGLLLFFGIFVSFKSYKENDKKFPFSIRNQNGSWRSSGPLEEDGEWLIFTDSDGRRIAIRGNVVVTQIDK